MCKINCLICKNKIVMYCALNLVKILITLVDTLYKHLINIYVISFPIKTLNNNTFTVLL